VHSHSTNHKGSIAELKIAAAAAELGIPVLAPLTEHGRYDLVFGLDGRFLRIQCKWAAVEGDVVVVRLRSQRLTSRGRIMATYTADEIDAVAAYCGDLDRCFLLPIELVAGKGILHLRLRPPKNHQRAAINIADRYDLGAVAQLGRALRWQRRGRGFESHQLHSSSDDAKSQVGAHEFRNLFGWYAERAAAGDEFLITRRGKPYVRLGPAQPPLAAAA
jgi:PD-(D/E)XK endonuclease